MVAGASLAATYFYPSLLADAVTILVTETLLGAGVLAVVLAALSVLVTFFDDHYRQVLDKVPGGLAGAMYPYRVVAAVGGLATAAGVVAALLWSPASDWQRSVLLSVPTGFSTWALVGTYGLVVMTLRHGLSRAELLRGIDEMKVKLAERKRRLSA